MQRSKPVLVLDGGRAAHAQQGEQGCAMLALDSEEEWGTGILRAGM